ncbi:Hemopexin [Aspergillus varians]
MVDAVYFYPPIQQAYFFSGLRYARIKFTPGTGQEEITFGPALISQHWPSLASIGFGTVDAVLPIDGTHDDAYFFFGGRFAHIRLDPHTHADTVVGGPWVITEKLSSLRKAGFDTVDSAIGVPDYPGQAYFFRGTNYVRVNVVEDQIVYGPAKLSVESPALTQAGFDSVDAALPQPGSTDGVTYFFKGDNYVKIKVKAWAPDEVTYGPRTILSQWKTLSWI